MVGIENALHEASRYLKKRIPFSPKIAVVLGTGLSDVAENLTRESIISYGQIPHFPVSTVETHAGNLVFGTWKNQEVVILQGRVHYYEGYSLQEVVFPVRLMKKIGVSTVILTNAAGGLTPVFSAGEVMVISDHINMIGNNPLRGPNPESLGDRFPSMNAPYSQRLAVSVRSAARELGIVLRSGVYVAVSGPSLETAAETLFLRMIGADAVGMSTVPEVIAAVHMGMAVLGLSVISNVNAPDALAPAPLEAVIATVRKAGPDVVRLIEGVLETWAED